MAQPILLTGAAGFIGSHVAQALLARGESVVGVDNFDPFYDAALKHANLDEVRATAQATATPDSFECVAADITDAAAMHTLFERTRPKGVIHLAAKAGVRPSIADPVGYAHANITGTAVMLDLARRAGCDRIVVASSSSVYGNSPTAPFSETQDVNAPISPYAATKRACELIGHTHFHLTGMPTAMLRFFTVFGPRQRPDLAINLFLTRIAKGEPIRMFGDGSMSRDFTFVADIVSGVLAAYDHIPAHGYRIWNLGHNHPVSLADMIATIETAVGKKAIIQREPMQPGDVQRTWADLTRSQAELGYSPSTSFEEGVAKHWAWLKSRLG
ncbi:MAG: NAD-dependent epimerase/dehydratase family protein [Tepidisphaera sp.]|nr:NAD-dependent epimerase/dehydratase family protein [Tepidisphaera sp.]